MAANDQNIFLKSYYNKLFKMRMLFISKSKMSRINELQPRTLSFVIKFHHSFLRPDSSHFWLFELCRSCHCTNVFQQPHKERKLCMRATVEYTSFYLFAFLFQKCTNIHFQWSAFDFPSTVIKRKSYWQYSNDSMHDNPSSRKLRFRRTITKFSHKRKLFHNTIWLVFISVNPTDFSYN